MNTCPGATGQTELRWNYGARTPGYVEIRKLLSQEQENSPLQTTGKAGNKKQLASQGFAKSSEVRTPRRSNPEAQSVGQDIDRKTILSSDKVQYDTI